MSDHQKVVARRFFEEQDKRRGGPAPELCADGYTAHLAGFPPFDLDAHQQFASSFYAAFPDLVHTIEDVVANGDQAAVRFRLTGTNTGSFDGQPATGKPIAVEALALMTLASGKVAELHGQFDRMALMEQIGAVGER